MEGHKRKDTITIDLSEKEEAKYYYIAGLLESHNWRSNKFDKGESPPMLNQLSELEPAYENVL